MRSYIDFAALCTLQSFGITNAMHRCMILTRKQQQAESYAIAETITTTLAAHGYQITGAALAGYTKGGRGAGMVQRYTQYDVRYERGRVTLCCVWVDHGNGYYTHNTAAEQAVRDAVKAMQQ